MPIPWFVFLQPTFIFASQDTPLSPSERLEEISGDMFGTAVACVGDVNGDGAPDFLVSDSLDPPGDPRLRSAVWLISGKDYRVLHSLRPDDPADSFGETLAGVGDIDGDGVPDFIVGAARAHTGEFGYVRAYSGKLVKPLYTVHVPTDRMKHRWESSCAGPSLCALGDVNLDGYADFAVGSALDSSRAKEAGRVRVFSGKDGSTLFSIEGENAGDHLGISIATAGDIDGDGRTDLIVGASPDFTPDGSRSGYALIVSGKDGHTLRRLDPPRHEREFGATVAGGRDLDGDGVPEVLVATSFVVERDRSRVRAYSGKTGAMLREWKARGGEEGWSFGAQLWMVGDCNGDGIPDIAVSAPIGLAPVGIPAVWILSGKEDVVLHEFTDKFGALSGVSVRSVGDIDRDGVEDLIIGSASIEGWKSFSGSVSLFSGKTGAPLRILTRAEIPAEMR
jgi:hypothetical protein